MQVIYLLIFFSATVAGIFLLAFIRAVKKDQFIDVEGPAIRMLFDDEKVNPAKHNQNEPIE